MISKLLGRIPAKIIPIVASVLIALAAHEGFSDHAIIPVPGDVPTIGFGHTKGVHMGDKITPQRALAVFHTELEDDYAAKLRKCITAPVYIHEFNAYLSLAYNVGAETVCKKAKPGKPDNLIDLINSEQYAAACARIDAFNKGPGKKVLRGLVIRRAEERQLCEGKLEKEYE